MNSTEKFRDARRTVTRAHSRIIEAAMAGRRACKALEEGDIEKTQSNLATMVMLVSDELAGQAKAQEGSVS